ncbi:MAG: UDP-N-acetylglucosamine 2-epimerase (hydrolyzing) [Rhodospirillaceae bacterium]|nr:UDP-N-acetylglucosamine 2-epimerase (hydrolyzing) [Rhodospirillaceae bacterium]
MSRNKSRRKICVVVNSRANYGRIKSVMRAVQDHPDLELQTIVGASLLYRFGHAVDNIRADGFEPSATVYSIVEGENPTTMAKSTGMAIMDLSTQFENLRPDVVLTVADRFETIATAIAASYMNIPVAHTQGGEVTGSIDESVRHAVSKLAHVHFPATELARNYLLRMGEEAERVHMTGCPAIDLIADLDLTLPSDLFSSNKGVGATLDPSQPYLVVLQHPVTTEFGQGFEQVQETLAAVLALDMQTAWLWPNVDAGSDDVSKGLRMHREINGDGKLHFYRNFTPEDYARLIANAACLIGNSSSGLREGAFLGTPTVDVGTRQARREHGENVVHAGYDRAEIEAMARQQIAHGRFPKTALFGDGSAGRQIADILAGAPISVQKRLSYS